MKNRDPFALCLTSDLFKLKKLKSVYIALALMFLLILLTLAMCWIGINLAEHLNVYDPTVVVDPPIGSVMQEEKDAMIMLFNMQGQQALMGSASACGLEFLIVIITCIFIGKDFSHGVVRINASRGVKRLHIYFSKWVTLAILIVAYSLFALLCAGILTALHSFFGTFGAHEFGILIRCFVLQLLANLATMSITAMIAFLCRSTGTSMVVSIAAYAVLSLLLSIISVIVPATGGSMEWMNFMPMQQMDLAVNMGKYSASELCAVIIMPIVYIALSSGIGLLTFLKRDIK